MAQTWKTLNCNFLHSCGSHATKHSNHLSFEGLPHSPIAVRHYLQKVLKKGILLQHSEHNSCNSQSDFLLAVQSTAALKNKSASSSQSFTCSFNTDCTMKKATPSFKVQHKLGPQREKRLLWRLSCFMFNILTRDFSKEL